MEQEMDLNATYTARQVAELLCLTPVTVNRLCAQGKIRASKIGNEYRITREAYLEYLESTKVKIENK